MKPRPTILPLALCLAWLIGAAPLGAGTRLVIWHETEAPIARALAAACKPLEAEGITVSVVRKDRLGDALKLLGNDPGAAPDLLWYAHDKVGLFAAMGMLEPLDPILAPGWEKDFLPLTVEAGRYAGRHYQVPVFFETLLFLYNKALMKEPPPSAEELLALMERETRPGHYVFVEQHSTAYYAAAWMHPFGGWIIDEKGRPGLDQAGSVAALEYHRRLVRHMPKDGEWNTVASLFLGGKAASTLNGPWLVPACREKGIELGFAPLPLVKVGGRSLPLGPYAGVQGLMLLKAGRQRDAAARLIHFAAGRQFSESLSLATGGAPAQRAAYAQPAIAGNALIQAMRAAAESARPMPNLPEMDVMWSTTETALAAINKRGAPVKESLERAQKESLERIASMR